MAKESLVTLVIWLFAATFPARAGPSLEGGEKPREAFEIYRKWEPDAHLEFDSPCYWRLV
jgi:hypothetical protein